MAWCVSTILLNFSYSSFSFRCTQRHHQICMMSRGAGSQSSAEEWATRFGTPKGEGTTMPSTAREKRIVSTIDSETLSPVAIPIGGG
jgi:hypothetical protein